MRYLKTIFLHFKKLNYKELILLTFIIVSIILIINPPFIWEPINFQDDFHKVSSSHDFIFNESIRGNYLRILDVPKFSGYFIINIFSFCFLYLLIKFIKEKDQPKQIEKSKDHSSLVKIVAWLTTITIVVFIVLNLKWSNHREDVSQIVKSSERSLSDRRIIERRIIERPITRRRVGR